MTDVFLHVGLSKTGTTTIQSALESRVADLAAAGVLFAGRRHRAQRLAAYDLLGQRIPGEDQTDVPGAFSRLMEEVRAYDGRSSIISEEALALARPRHVRRIVRELAGHRLFVVVTVRDLARMLVSAWQQSVVMGDVWAWEEFVAAVREPGRGAVAPGVAFWLREDVLRVVDTWAAEIPLERIRLVTVPPRGCHSDLLLRRFGAATGLPDALWDERVTPRNPSLGAAEVEMIRRLNRRIVGPLNTAQYRYVIEHGIRPELQTPHPRPLTLPPEQLSWTRERSQALVAEVRRRGLQVFGDLDDLIPVATEPGRRLDDVTESELLAAAEAALASLAVAHGRLFRRYRLAFERAEGRKPNAAEVAGSSVRAVGFGLSKALLKRASGNRLLGVAARTYLRRTSRLVPPS